MNTKLLCPISLLLLGASACGDWSLRRRTEPDEPRDTDSATPEDSDVPDSDADTDTGDSDPPPPTCPPVDVPAESVPTMDCRPPFRSFTFTEKWRVSNHSGNFVSVLQLDDDNGDGQIGWGDVPEVLLRRQDQDVGLPHLRVHDGESGVENDVWVETFPMASLLVAQLQPAPIGPKPAVFSYVPAPRPNYEDAAAMWDTMSYPAAMKVLEGRGTIRCHPYLRYSAADLDGDGWGELLSGHRWYSPTTGASFQGSGGGVDVGRYDLCTVLSVDLDGDAPAEVVSGNTIYADDGSVRCRLPGAQGYTFALDLDGDGEIDFVRVTPTELARFDQDCNAVQYRGLSDGYHGELGTKFDFVPEGFAVAPLLDRVGSDLVIYGTAGTSTEAMDWGWFAIGQDLVARRLTRRKMPTTFADLDGDGLYEMFVGPDLIDPRTGAVLGTLPTPKRAEVVGVADVDGDGEAELLVRYCEGEDYCLSPYLAVFEGDGLAPAQRWYQAEPLDRAGYQNEDGSFTKAGEYPPLSVYNTMNVADVNAEWEGFGARLAVSFAEVCTDECASDRLRVALTVENTGTVSLIRPVELVLSGEVAGVRTELGRARVPTLAAGARTAGQELWLTGTASRATALQVQVEAPGWTPMTCEPLPSRDWEGAGCP